MNELETFRIFGIIQAHVNEIHGVKSSVLSKCARNVAPHGCDFYAWYLRKNTKTLVIFNIYCVLRDYNGVIWRHIDTICCGVT